MLSTESKTLLRSLHTCLRLTIYYDDAVNEDRFILPYQNYCQEVYHYQDIVRYALDSSEDYACFFGDFNEAFLTYRFAQAIIVLVPFRYDTLTKEELTQLINEKHLDQPIEQIKIDHLHKILSALPIYSLEKTNELLILLLACLGRQEEGLTEKELRLFGNDYRVKADLENLHIVSKKSSDYELSLYAHESAIKEYVKQSADQQDGKKAIDIVQPLVQNVTGNSLRYEKDYSLIIFELLTHTAITSGSTITDAYKLRQSYLSETESAKTIDEIMTIRASAISSFKSIISEAKETSSNPFITSVLQYIDLNIHSDLKVNTIAEYFHVSGTNLRKQFKDEVKMPIKRYILSCKMELAKKMLSSGISSTDIAKSLSFSDQSHFSRAFKSFTGLTPMEYKRANIGKLLA